MMSIGLMDANPAAIRSCAPYGISPCVKQENVSRILGRGNLVNLRHIEKIKGFIIYMDNGKELQIAQKRSSDFREEVNKFLQKNS